MKTEIFCIFFAVLCLAQSSKAIKCYTCEKCSDGRKEITCADGESCGKITVIKTLLDTTEKDSMKSCIPAGISCEQHLLDPDTKRGLQLFNTFLGAFGGNVDYKCDLCNNKDFCNSSAAIYPSLALFLSAVAFIFTTF